MKKYSITSYRICLLILLLLGIIVSKSHSQAGGGFGSIVGLQGGQVTINWGSNDGVKTGTGFIAFRKSQMVHPETGEYLSIERDIIGRIEITKVYPAYSVGRFTSTQKPPQVGDLVELVIDTKRQYPYQEPQASKGTIINRTGNTVTFTMGVVDGIEKGLYFDVFRGSEKNGTIIVSQVSDETSMASIMSGIETVQVGDRVELADQQQADKAVSTITPPQHTAPAMVQPPAVPPGTVSSSPLPQVEQPVLFGTINSIEGNKIKFKWLNKKVPAKTGVLAGIYRQEQLTHPVTGENLGAPSVLIGQLRVDEAKRKDGKGTIISQEVAPRKGDNVGYIAQTAAAPPPVTQAIPVRPRWQSGGSLQKTASEMNQELMNIQHELTFLRSMGSRIENIERNMTSQQKITRSLQRDMRLIKQHLGLISGGTVPAGEQMIPAQAPTELFGSHPEKSKAYSFRVSDDFKVKLQVQDKTILVSMDRDSVHVQEVKPGTEESTPAIPPVSEEKTSSEDTSIKAEAIPPKDSSGGTPLVDYDKLISPEEAAPVPFYIAHWKIIAGGVGALLLLLIASLFLKKKKPGKKKKAVEDEKDEDLEEEEVEEENVEGA